MRLSTAYGCDSDLACTRRSPRRGVAPEGYAQLEVALPSLLIVHRVRAEERQRMGRVVIGMDPHKRSATIEVIDARERVLAQGRYATDTGGYAQLLAAGRRFPDRVWAVEGCAGIGRHLAQRLLADGETVVDVPAKLSARVR